MRGIRRAIGASPLGLVLLVGCPIVWGVGACGGVCSDVEAAWQHELRREQALVGPGLTALGSREVHLGLTLSQHLLQVVSEPLNAELPLLETRVSAGAGSERRAAVEIRARPVIQELEVIGGNADAVRLQVRIETHVIVRRPGTRQEHDLPGTATVVGGLELRRDDDGDVVLFLRPLLPQSQVDEPVLTIDQPVGTLSASVAQTLRGFVEPGVQQVLANQAPIPVLRFRDLALGALVVELAPAELRLYPEEGSVFIGFVTNLRPLPRERVAPRADVTDFSMRYFVHPGLPEAAVRLALAEGALERGLVAHDESGEAASGTSALVSFDSLELADGQFELVLRAWDYTDRCGVESWEARGPVRLDKGAVSLDLTELTGADGAAVFEPERVEDVVARSLGVAQSVVDLRGIVLGDGTVLPVEATDLVLADDRLEVLFSR